jgi:hypothetical protein
MLHKDIAARVGIHPRTVNRVLKAGERPRKPAKPAAPTRMRAIPQGTASPVPAVLLAPLPLKPPGQPRYYR